MVALKLANRFRVVRTIDVAVGCFAERPFKAALTAAQRAMRGMVKDDLLRRYRTDRFQTVYGLSGKGADWLVRREVDTVRLMKEEKPHLNKGDFVKVTGKLKADFYLSRDGKPTGTLLVIAFEAAKISKPVAQPAAAVE